MKKTVMKALTILLFGTLCFSLPSPLTEVSFVCGQTSPPWLSGWLYRKSHVINYAPNTGTNYQMRVNVHYNMGTDNGEDVYLEWNCRPDFGDIRFTDDDGTTLLDCFMEAERDYDYATFWVEVRDDLSDTSRTIYVYYCKSDATTLSNGFLTHVFQLREHKYCSNCNPEYSFFRVNIYPSLRTALQMSSGAGQGMGYIFVVVPRAWLNGKYLRFSWQGLSPSFSSSPSFPEWGHAVSVYDGIYLRSSMTDFPNGDARITKGNGLLQTVVTRTGGFDLVTEDVLINTSKGSQYFCTIFFEENNGYQVSYLQVDWIEVNNGSNGNGNIDVEDFDKSEELMEETGTENDYGLYRKYVRPEPSHGSWGIEESAGGETKTDSWRLLGMPILVLIGIGVVTVVLFIKAVKIPRKYKMEYASANSNKNGCN